MRFEQLLHETIEEMSAELTGPPSGLAAASMARGRRIRRTRRLAAVAAAVAAVVAVALPWALLSQPQRRAEPAAPGLPGGWVVTAVGNQVLDRATGEYVTLPVDGTVLPAPVGDRVLVDAGPGSVRLMNVHGADAVTVDTTDLGGAYSWSPGGDRLVTRVTQKEPFKLGYAVIDARTGAVTRHWIDHEQYDCGRCNFVWFDHETVVLPIADRSGGAGQELVDRLEAFDVTTGRHYNPVPAGLTPSGPFAQSPGGQYIVGDLDGTGKNWRLIDLSTGQLWPFPYDAVWVNSDELLAAHDGKVYVLTRQGTVTATVDVHVPGPGRISLGRG
ncbi:hypothetical protein Daura_13945 [Dactylosporangium aurantiacum]|uniref:Uncharacterized protein n=1 Tax=Dactylosporangium aurantiacum TaxID=35754 RepID=A0A9Q9IKD1_9ACTN|nr:hypothetical protein [Dactylosporangium aurantiacum]MDG6109803.1 hypothetical protein [Dactylosporangium aurantiacum]UWZ57166.1 hypothetical protein Daura_13945 [Dactylosporangium aurantiacum]